MPMRQWKAAVRSRFRSLWCSAEGGLVFFSCCHPVHCEFYCVGASTGCFGYFSCAFGFLSSIIGSELLLLMIFALLFCCLIEWLSTAGPYVYGECSTQLSEMLHYLHVFVISFSANPLQGVNMSVNALKDLNVPQSVELEKTRDNSVKSCITKPVLNSNRCVNKEENAPPACPDAATNAVTNGCESGNADVEYIDSENLTDLPDVDASISTLVARLDSKDWVMTCEALNNVRQLAIYHKERLQELLEPLVSLIVKSVKNPRSAVCKTALMTCADIFKAYGDLMVDSIDPLLMQLFLKSSQDKRFVCEAAEVALISMTSWISPALLVPKMQPYLKNRNPRIRAKASMCFSKSVPRLDVEGIKEYGMDKLIQIAATQLSDQLPESREAARNLALELQVFYEKSRASNSGEGDGTAAASPEAESWEAFCQSKLSPLSAQAVLRVTSTTKEGVTAGVTSTPKEGVTVGC